MRHPYLGALAALGAAMLACVLAPPAPPGSRMVAERRWINHDGLERSFLVIEPPDASPADPRGLVVGLHGGGSEADQFCNWQPGGVAEAAVRHGFYMVCPEGIEGHWNDGRRTEQYRAHREETNDVGFILAVVDQLILSEGIEPGRVFVTGASNGGMMTFRLACEEAGRFSGAAALIANLPAGLTCHPDQPIPMMIINGTEDPLMPYKGGPLITLGRRDLGEVLSIRDSLAFWARSNGCQSPPRVRRLPDRSEADRSRLIVHEYERCQAGNGVVLIEMNGAGHTLPGGLRYAPRALIGRVNRDARVGDLVLEFFLAVP